MHITLDTTFRPETTYQNRHEIAKKICDKYGIPLETVQSPIRTSIVVKVRRAIAKELWDGGMTLQAIGNFLGGREHSTIIHLLRD